jgi:pimeloyl-ACP methyl ester carboxylesterase
MTSVDDTLGSDSYNEFALLYQNAEEWGLTFDEPPVVRRDRLVLPTGQALSFLRWGEGDPELVFMHGGGQNSHTWDTVLLALGRPAIAIDLPGHGHSDRREDRNYGPWENAEAVATLLETLPSRPLCVVGMSLGGATLIRLAARRPELCRRAVIVDVTPQINDPTRPMTTAERGSVALIGGPPIYDSFEEMAAAAVALSPLRAASGVRRGVRHNTRRLEDGRWTWRYDLLGARPPGGPNWSDFTALWQDVGAITVPTLFVRGGESAFVRDEDVKEMRRWLPSIEVVVVEGAGHAIQSDRPLELAAVISRFIEQ